MICIVLGFLPICNVVEGHYYSGINHEGATEMQTIKTSGNRAVVINDKNGRVWANLYTNARDGIAQASITPIKWNGSSVANAMRWADKILAA